MHIITPKHTYEKEISDMAIEALKDDALTEAVGGISMSEKDIVRGQSVDPNAAHWQPKDHRPGESWEMNGHTWYMIKFGDTLFNIAQAFHTDLYKIQKMNPLTITDIGKIYVNDAIVVL